MIALMVGGSEDGKVMEVPPTSTIRGWQAPKPGLDPQTGIVWGKEVHYRRTEVEILGLRLPVYILEGWPAERVEATLAQHLLSDLARRLAE